MNKKFEIGDICYFISTNGIVYPAIVRQYFGNLVGFWCECLGFSTALNERFVFKTANKAMRYLLETGKTSWGEKVAGA